MARRIIVDNILRLIKAIGGNPKNFMGTRTNINFLGKGPNQPLLEGQLDMRVVDAFPREQIISEAEKAGGYLTANKLNDLQLQRLENNLIQLDKVYNPPANITDMATRTGGLTEEGIGSLRREKEFTDFFTPDKSKEFAAAMKRGVTESDAMKKAGLDPSKQSDYWKWEGMGKGDVTKAPTYEFIDPAAEKVSYASKFNPRNEVHVNKAKALLEDPQLKGVYTEAEVKNAYDFEGLYQSHFDKGHVDIARLFEQAGHNIPELRGTARQVLLDLMKKNEVPFAEIDIKYITEGGGGRAGDPINLMVKYFGKNVTENLPKESTKENITRFTEFLTRAKDARGRGIKDPFFDRESIEFSEFAAGGRVDADGLGEILQVPRSGYSKGRAVKGLMNLVNKKFGKGTLKRALDVAPSTKYETLAAVSDFERREMIRNKYQGLIDDDLLNKILVDDNPQRIAEILATIDEMLVMQNVKGMGPEAIIESFKESWKRKPSASGGLAKILEV